MAIVPSGAVAIKDDTLQGGSTSIALEVDGNTTGDKHLATLGATAGLSAGGTNMSEFYSYSSVDPPASPTLGNATDTAALGIDIDWQDNASDEDGFEVHRAEGSSPGAFSFHQTLATVNLEFWNDSIAIIDLEYYTYRIYAYNEGGLSNYTQTNTVQATDTA